MRPGDSHFNASGVAMIGKVTADTLSSLKEEVQAGNGIAIDIVGESNADSTWANATLRQFRIRTEVSNAQLSDSLESLGPSGTPIIKLLGL